jgi:hypothetical protein
LLPASVRVASSSYLSIQKAGDFVVIHTSIPQLVDPGEAALFDRVRHESSTDGISAKGRVVPRSALPTEFCKCLDRALRDHRPFEFSKKRPRFGPSRARGRGKVATWHRQSRRVWFAVLGLGRTGVG